MPNYLVAGLIVAHREAVIAKVRASQTGLNLAGTLTR